MAKDKADKKAGSGDAEGGKGGKGGKLKKLAIPAVLVVGFFAGGKVMGGQGGGEAATKVVIVAPTTTLPGPVVALDPITMNLSDGRLLRVGIAFQKAGNLETAGGGGHGGKKKEDETDPTKGYAKALDIVIDVLGDMTYDELVKPEGRDGAKAEIIEKLERAYHGEIQGVYFHQFVMQ